MQTNLCDKCLKAATVKHIIKECTKYYATHMDLNIEESPKEKHTFHSQRPITIAVET